MTALPSHYTIRRPLITERGTYLTESRNAYLFEVDKGATKSDIRRAVEERFGVKVMKVRTANVLGKHRRARSGSVKLPDWKKAIVTLAEGQRIEFI
ncbi:MAG: 50S ribosomal protein L23 [Planctomycetota bacterium]